MKRLDDGKVSLVEFLRSIQFASQSRPVAQRQSSGRFAHFYPRARGAAHGNGEDFHLVRSAN